MAVYEAQDRGSSDAYQRYLEGMDASMRQKVALTAAHLLCRGKVADMGMGSGSGSHALAQLYPELEVIGVDIDPTMVGLAEQKFVLPNLSFKAGDIAAPVFPDGSLDCILDSSVLHHVTSFNGYVHDAAGKALAQQVPELADYGVLIVRDFLDPGHEPVLLDLPDDDGDQSNDPLRCSTAALYRRFSGEFRKLAAMPGFELDPAGEASAEAGFVRFRTTRKLAAEFLLRKDYRSDWSTEVLEEYTYFTQSDFERTFQELGLRVLASTPLYNPWILRHRFEGKFRLWSLAGQPLEPPATNYVIVGERVKAGEGVRFQHRPATPLGFLELCHFRHHPSGRVFDLVRRPNLTLDVLPWFEAQGSVFVLARMSYPRPILGTAEQAALDHGRFVEFASEPLSLLQTDKPIGLSVEEMLARDAGLESPQIRGFLPGSVYYPSPGGVAEEVRSTFVEIEPAWVATDLGQRSGFSSSGRVRAIEAQQLLRAAQVGGLPDARLELNTYDLLLRLGRPVGPWIGESIDPSPCVAAPRRTTLPALLDAAPRRLFGRVAAAESTHFLELRASHFAELDSTGRVLAERTLEYVVPATLGLCTVSCLVLCRTTNGVWVGLDDTDLPAAQVFNGNSNLLVTPAWRIPKDRATTTPARQFVRERLHAEYGLETGRFWELGGRYHPSAGATPEAVYPVAVEVVEHSPAPAHALHWVNLDELVSQRTALTDGHLRIAVLRAAHALGRLPT
jgi:SAM-dependent methyltransferase